MKPPWKTIETNKKPWKTMKPPWKTTETNQKCYITDPGSQLTSFDPKTWRHWQGDLLWSKNVTSLTGGSNWPPLIQKRDVTDRGIQLTSFGPKNVTSLTEGTNWPFRCLDLYLYLWDTSCKKKSNLYFNLDVNWCVGLGWGGVGGSCCLVRHLVGRKKETNNWF